MLASKLFYWTSTSWLWDMQTFFCFLHKRYDKKVFFDQKNVCAKKVKK
jgi:hypothetical protein